METPLYKAPYPNISTTDVCMGSASMQWQKSMSEKKIITEVEKRFFGSKFSHHLTDDRVVKGNYQQLMLSLNGEFPVDKLIKLEKKLKDVI
jgi:hypothetical protein